MKPFICSALSLLICLISSSALAQNRVLTVDNNPLTVAMFKNITNAYEAAQPGDTILLAGSPTSYGDLILKKRLNIVGPGYFLAENTVPGLSTHPANVQIFLGISAEGSIAGSTLTGLALLIGFDGSVGNLTDRLGDIVIDRCQVLTGNSHFAFPNLVTIRRSIIFNPGGGYALELTRAGSSIRNCITTRDLYLRAGATAANCVFLYYSPPSTAELSSISSSIFAFSDPSVTSARFAQSVKGSVTYCMAVAPITGANFLPAGGGNINGVATEQVFLGTGSEDAQWKLRANSPALGKGFDGVDMGAFGGLSPYILSGVPSIPRVTRFVVPAVVTSTSGLKFEVDAQSF